MRFAATELTGSELELQGDVRRFLDEQLPRGTYQPGLGMVAPRDQDFSRKLAERGWLGMALPRRYGGGDRSAVERFIVVEELLRRGAPVGYHWVADRQTGPVIARFGSEALKGRFLPAICRAEVSFSIGMSEPQAGSDLAAVQTRATRAAGGWRLNGTKIWTGGAHVNDWFVVLCRTSDADDRHAGLSQLIVDLRSPGLQARPIPYLDGSEFFCEVRLDDVFVPDELVLGEIGSGWAQNTSELAFERAGPERWLSTYLLVEQFLRERGDDAATVVGEALAGWWAIRALSLSVARAIDAGAAPAAESALVKELGTRFEQQVLDAVWRLVEVEPGSDSPLQRLLAAGILGAPAFTIRGGTNEILRSVAARGLTSPPVSAAHTAGGARRRRAGSESSDEALASLRDGPDPRIESAALGQWLVGGDGLVTVAPRADEVEFADGCLRGLARGVPWARDADRIVVVVGDRVCVVDRARTVVEPHVNLGGDARDTVVFEGARCETVALEDAAAPLLRGALTRVVLMAGGLERICAMTIDHAAQRRQFGRPIASFQAVQQLLVTVAQQTALVGVAAECALRRRGGPTAIGAAKLLAGRAALVAGRAAHQVHGARGVTLEHPLGGETRRLWSWRGEYGDERLWSARLGSAALRAGADALYPAICGS